MSDLLPCPFCGSVELLYIDHMKETILHPYRVVCDNCGSAGGYRDSGNHVKAWNSRAHPAVQPAAREAALQEVEEALRKWQDNLILCGYKETAITVGMAADLIATLKGETT